MRALVYDGVLRLGTLPRPRPDAQQVRLRVRACGIARDDLERSQGRRPVEVRPVVLGHQVVGVVDELGDQVDEGWRGRRVVTRCAPGCGRCVNCRVELPWLCEQGIRGGIGMGLVDGALAEWVVCDVRTLEPVPESVEDDEAVFAQPVALALEVMKQVQGPAPQRVLVVGDGNMGLLVTLVLHAAGHTVSVFGRHPSRRELLWRSGIGFTPVPDTVVQGRGSLPEDLQDHFATVVDCSGHMTGFRIAAQCVRPRGRVVLVSDPVGQGGTDLTFLVRREAELVGVSGGPLEPALDFLARKGLDVLPLISARVALMDGVSSFETAARRGSLKTILVHGELDS